MHWLIPLYSLREPQTKTILLFLSLIKEVLIPLFRKMKCSFCASRLIISCVNPPPDCLIPTEYLTKSLKSLALYLAQGIMGGINIHRHDLVFIILEIERERFTHYRERDGEWETKKKRQYENWPGFSLLLCPIFPTILLGIMQSQGRGNGFLKRKRK